jgi:chemotaxis regulatin CheY-phosphate phosphatase CheZ
VDDWPELELPEPPSEAPPLEEGAEPPPDQGYYRELSHDMYREVGRLARRLSMSIRDVKVEKVSSLALDAESAGEQLEHAKDQLEAVVKMTEQATNRIIDQGESIQEAIDQARALMQQISTGGAEAEGAEAGPEAEKAQEALRGAIERVSGWLEGLGGDPLAELAGQARELAGRLAEAAPAQTPAPDQTEAPAQPEAQPQAGGYQFPLDLVFQTIYELCTNETVKKHIKAMWEAGDQAFDQAAVEKALNGLAPAEPDEDNFLVLDLKGVLKALFQATGEDRYKQVVKKMAATVDQIFLEQTLPLEAIPAEGGGGPAPAPAPEPEPAQPPPELEALAGAVRGLAEAIAARSAELAPPELEAPLSRLVDDALAAAPCGPQNTVQPELVQELDQRMGQIFSSANSIIEALSFQDLSGQTIYRIVKLLTDFQVQLLAMVVGFGSKLKAKAEREELTPDESERMAQQEVDRVLDTLGVREEPQEGEGGKLDQDSVNSLLESMGF